MKTWGEEREEIGEARGREIGEARGKRLEAQEIVLRVLEARFGPLPPTVVERIRQTDDQSTLDALVVRAATAASVAETGLV